MGDPRKLRNKYERPKKLWTVDRLREESPLKSEYGLKNMRELWMATAELKKMRREARRLLSITEEEREEDAKKLLAKLARYEILKPGSKVEDVLSLGVKDVLERRLQTIVLRKGLARTIAQSRQLITHGFISVNGRKVTRPNYAVIGSDVVEYARQIDITVKPAEQSEPEKPAEGPEAPSPPEAAAGSESS